MMQYDLSNTRLAKSSDRRLVPSEGELNAVSLAMMLAADCSWSDLGEHTLVLTRGNQETVARLIEERLCPLARDIGSGSALRGRLAELVGLAITRSPGGLCP